LSERYFARYAWPQPLFPELRPAPNLEMVVVIPSYNEPDLIQVIQHLISIQGLKKGAIYLLVVHNEPESSPLKLNRENHRKLLDLGQDHGDKQLFSIHLSLPDKKAGVGLARKIGLDQAAWWFHQLNRSGIIVWYDADAYCAPDYFNCIAQFYQEHPTDLGLVFYEHPMENEAIVDYELHLRYYIDALRWCGYAFAYQTLGSCITVTSDVYLRYGGMNTRKAGEDFYFLHQLFPHIRFGEINQTTVYPSPRISDRVPFGTGHAVGKYEAPYHSYHPEIFPLVHSFLKEVQTPPKFKAPLLNQYATEVDLHSTLAEIKDRSPTSAVFEKHFRNWFSGFQVLKMVHFLRDQAFPNQPLEAGLNWLNQVYWQIPAFSQMSRKEKLIAIRKKDRTDPRGLNQLK
jgi:hypothetical protein